MQAECEITTLVQGKLPEHTQRPMAIRGSDLPGLRVLMLFLNADNWMSTVGLMRHASRPGWMD